MVTPQTGLLSAFSCCPYTQAEGVSRKEWKTAGWGRERGYVTNHRAQFVERSPYHVSPTSKQCGPIMNSAPEKWVPIGMNS
jgi:hypothetical protein